MEKDYIILFGATTLGTFIYILITSVLFNDAFKKYVFRGHIGNFYPYFLVLAIVILAFGILLLRRMVMHAHTSLLILTIGVFFAGISYFFGFLNFDPTGTVNFRQTRFFQIQVLTQTISVFAFYLHYELNLRKEPRPWLISSITLLLTPYSVVNIFHLITNSYTTGTIFNQFELLALVLLQLGVIFLFTWLLTTGYEITKSFDHLDQKTIYLARMQLAGISIIYLGIIFQLIENFTPLNVWHTPLNSIGILLIAVPYTIDPKVMLFAPVRIKLLGVIDNIGRTLYYKAVDEEFAKDEKINATAELFGGLTLAFSSIGAEVAKSTKGVDSMKFADRSIIIEYDFPYYILVIADTSSYFLEREMAEYLRNLKDIYPEVPEKGLMIPEDVFAELDEKFFPVYMR